MSLVPRRYHNIYLISFQCLLVGIELYIANKLIENAMFGRVQFARYISAPIALRYGTSRPSNSSFFLGRNESLFTSSERTTIGELVRCDLYIYNRFNTFSIYVDWYTNMSFEQYSICRLRQYLVFHDLSFQIYFSNSQLFL